MVPTILVGYCIPHCQLLFKWQLWYLSWGSCRFVSRTEISVSMEGRLIMSHVQMGFQSMCGSSAMATGHHLSASHQGWNPSLLEADQQCWFSQLFPSLSWKETVVSSSVQREIQAIKTCHKEVTKDILLLLLMFLVFCDVNWMVYSVCCHFKKCIKLSVIRTWSQ